MLRVFLANAIICSCSYTILFNWLLKSSKGYLVQIGCQGFERSVHVQVQIKNLSMT